MTDHTSPECICVQHARALPWPTSDTHKHSRGRLAVVAGASLQTGAARLAARAGQRIGAGWVSLFGSRSACDIMAHHETSILICEFDHQAPLAHQLADFDAIVIGPALGLDAVSRGFVTDLIKHHSNNLVLDADALVHIGADKVALFQALKARPNPAILTPHSGEFDTLFGPFHPSNKIVATIAAARQSGCVIVHKGATTVLAHPDGQIAVSTCSAPFLATAGTGDVLAGMIGGLSAQGLPSLAACKAAIWIHCEAGRRIGPGLIAEDLINELPNILVELRAGTAVYP